MKNYYYENVIKTLILMHFFLNIEKLLSENFFKEKQYISKETLKYFLQ